MGRLYIVGTEQVSCAAAQDVLLIKAPATMVLKLVSFRLGQSSSTTSTQQRVRVSRLTATISNGSGGSGPTPRKTSQGDPAATFTARANDTTQATTSGSKTTLFEDAFNILSGYQYVPVPEEFITIPPSEGLAIEFPAMGATATYDVWAVVEEIG